MALIVPWIVLDRKPGSWVQVAPEYWSIDNINRDTINAEIALTLEEIAKWSVDNNCGRRMAYDMWQFKKRADLTAFLLKWAS